MKKFLCLVFYTVKYLFIYVLLQSLVTTAAILFMEKELYIKDLKGVDDLVIKYSYTTLPVSIIVTFIVYYLLFKFEKEDLIKYCDFRKFKYKYILPIIFLTIGFTLMLSPISKFEVNIYSMSKEGIIGFLGLLIFVPIFEEILFRGIIYNKLRENIDVFSAIIIQALIYGLFHGNAFQAVYTGVLGVILAIVYTWSDSIWTSILTHGIFNLLGLIIMPLLINFSKGVTRFYIPIYTTIGIIILFVSFRNLYRIARTREPFNDFFVEL
ncbi:CPBP family intramembrane glutamic endopeptidase [Clostridium sp. ZS2-4]|uniref:CPBP family intramembrane glutamic endopeptidase n=1 Tax=Clostridium sp. ZS2-4 TaxID=2987703 RepID=UPI00227C0708|nr:CPBP family intramembrane glutamic endopeptidase [Clostridium sp. ZS2-4]MCY6355021.1 CPBP family intramembrane metalloprotease [Clostridium sp. ZS2-4]